MTAASDEWWLRGIAAEEALLRGHLLQFCNQLLFQIRGHACTASTITECVARPPDPSKDVALYDLHFCATDTFKDMEVVQQKTRLESFLCKNLLGTPAGCTCILPQPTKWHELGHAALRTKHDNSKLVLAVCDDSQGMLSGVTKDRTADNVDDKDEWQ